MTDGRLTVAVEFGPKAGFAIDTDDAFVLTELGVVETLVRADPNGQGLPGLAVVTALRYVSSVAAPPRGIKGVGLQAAAEGLDAVRVSTTNPDPILPLRLSRAARNTTFDASPVRALARIVVASGLTARRLARNLWGGAGGPVGTWPSSGQLLVATAPGSLSSRAGPTQWRTRPGQAVRQLATRARECRRSRRRHAQVDSATQRGHEASRPARRR